MQLTNHSCGEENCELTLRKRNLGAALAFPRRARTTPALAPAEEVERCVAVQRDGERCDNSAREGVRVCGAHGEDVQHAVRRGFDVHADVYAVAPHTPATRGASEDAVGPHVRMVERNRPRGAEYECPHHGTQQISDVPPRYRVGT